MKKMSISEIKPGMVTARRVFTPGGQFLIGQGTVLTAQMISHMQYYKVPHAYIEESAQSRGPNAFVEERHVPTHSEKVKQSKEFRLFKASFNQKTEVLRSSFNDLVLRGKDVDTDKLLSETLSLIARQPTTLSLFDMLHNMRQNDDSTYAHSLNVALIARTIGTWLGLSESDLDALTLCGLFHDIGKTGVPEKFIDKPGKLTPAEFNVIKMHPKMGYDILKAKPLDGRVKNAALMHHERCDGSGYPQGLVDQEIDDFACIIAIADVYDAMTSDRCYRAGLCPFEAIALFETEGLQKYRAEYILTFLSWIANTYVNNDVLLSNGQTGEIVMINRRLTRPLVKTGPNEFVNLEERLDLYVQAII